MIGGRIIIGSHAGGDGRSTASVFFALCGERPAVAPLAQPAPGSVPPLATSRCGAAASFLGRGTRPPSCADVRPSSHNTRTRRCDVRRCDAGRASDRRPDTATPPATMFGSAPTGGSIPSCRASPQGRLQLEASPVQARLDAILGHPHHLCDLSRRQSFDLSQEHDGSVGTG